MFDKFDMHPNDMEFECKEVSNEIFVNYLEIVTSHAVEVSGRTNPSNGLCTKRTQDRLLDLFVWFTNNQLKTS